jgi:hypothetical protein
MDDIEWEIMRQNEEERQKMKIQGYRLLQSDCWCTREQKSLDGFVQSDNKHIGLTSLIPGYNQTLVKSQLGKDSTVPRMIMHLLQQWDLMSQSSIESSWQALKSHQENKESMSKLYIALSCE